MLELIDVPAGCHGGVSSNKGKESSHGLKIGKKCDQNLTEIKTTVDSQFRHKYCKRSYHLDRYHSIGVSVDIFESESYLKILWTKPADVLILCVILKIKSHVQLTIQKSKYFPLM